MHEKGTQHAPMLKKPTFFLTAIIAAVTVLSCASPGTVSTEQVSTTVPKLNGQAEPSSSTEEQAVKTDSDSVSYVDEQAAKILLRATDYLTSLERFHLQADIVMDVVQESGQKLQFGSTLEVTVRRPDRLFAARMRDDGSIRRVWYNGKTTTIYEESENAYGQIPVPDTIDAMLDYLESVIEAPQPLADLMYSDLSYIHERYASALYIGKNRIGNAECHHLAFRGESVDWQVWVQQGENPLIRKFLITYKELPGEPQLAARFEQWDILPQVSDALFQFSPPAGAQKIVVVLLPPYDVQGGAK